MHITEKQLILVSEIAAKQAVEAYREHIKRQEKEKHDRRLRNIKLLLNNYRSLVLHCEKWESDLEEFVNTSIQDLDLEDINLEAIESIKESKSKSIAIVHYLRGKIKAYKSSCSEDELRYFRVLEKRYITKRKYTIQEIATIESIDRATVHRYLNKAMESLPVIFFGVEAIEFEK